MVDASHRVEVPHLTTVGLSHGLRRLTVDGEVRFAKAIPWCARHMDACPRLIGLA